MVVVMQAEASEEQIQNVIDHLVSLGFDIHRSTGVSQTVLGAVGVRPDFDPRDIELLAGVRVVVSEVMDPSQIALMLPYVDVLQVGARNMQNYHLLRALGTVDKPVLLKRGMSATIEEWLLSAEYIMSGGNYNVILCERGIRTFETSTRNTLDIAAIPVIQKLSHLPILADPSHGTGRRDKVGPMARAAVAAGADGLLLEVHNDPEHALSDGAQSLHFEQFEELMAQLRMIAPAVGRSITA